MKHKTPDVMFENTVFIWIALATSFVLLIPLAAMQFTTDVNWDKTDFIVMGFLVFGMASLFVLAARRVPPKYRAFVGCMIMAAFLFTWAELAVGVFSNLGS